ncbi:uncharacterized protein MELLADRAFT_57517 [Melampsora larici-populina 98AG31]|uniref:Uncharacterized protein n=1 Tax=Melampsora larici-populina (strain 98AG31 / pathotype 3-4-7) TaxID=747676 RepID=F4S380_MELLP|nr:uncharacterized protein MELLADRAFT_57517 [Melampsora larici-populina 98AG31]EGG00936.1 hypothetical protein MELLADRAFT_57517 [Melampsora larici-populina 98AG31]
MSQKKTVFGAVNSPGFGAYAGDQTDLPSFKSTSTSYTSSLFAAPVSEPKPLFGTSPAKFSTPFSTSNSIPKETTPPSSSTVPGFTSSFGKPSAFSTATPGVTSSSGQSTSTTLPKISTTEFFEKREFEVGSTLAFDPIKLAQWLEKHCHSFTNDSSLKLLVKMATVQPAPTSKEPTDESSPNLNSASTSKEPTNGSSPDLNSSTPETSPSTSTTNIQPEPAKPSVEDPMTRLNRFDKITLSDPITFSTTVWEHALSVLSKDSNYTVEMIQDARLVTEYQIGIKFQELMTSASNTPRFVKGVQTFSKQVGEVLDEVFGKLCKLAEEQESLLKE